MKGLVRSNIYVMLATMKSFLFVVTVLGVLAILLRSSTQMTVFCAYIMVGFAASAMSSMHNDAMTKWGKYKLTLPVKRSAIVGSYYVCHLLWLLVGITFAAVVTGLCFLLYGTAFMDRETDILMILTLGGGAGLLIGAFFFPLYYLLGVERQGIVTMISFACSFGLIVAIAAVVNELFSTPDGISNPKMAIASAIVLAIALLAFIVSYFISVRIYRKKEF